MKLKELKTFKDIAKGDTISYGSCSPIDYTVAYIGLEGLVLLDLSEPLIQGYIEYYVSYSQDLGYNLSHTKPEIKPSH